MAELSVPLEEVKTPEMMGSEPAAPTLDNAGMTQRAAMAVGALTAAVTQHPDESPEFIARRAVAFADELLKALYG